MNCLATAKTEDNVEAQTSRVREGLPSVGFARLELFFYYVAVFSTNLQVTSENDLAVTTAASFHSFSKYPTRTCEVSVKERRGGS